MNIGLKLVWEDLQVRRSPKKKEQKIGKRLSSNGDEVVGENAGMLENGEA
jgi:hypothetical protein